MLETFLNAYRQRQQKALADLDHVPLMPYPQAKLSLLDPCSPTPAAVGVTDRDRALANLRRKAL